jgi:hypothetical protein
MITPFTPAIRDTNKPRILIVDDNPRFSQSARRILQHNGQYVVCEENCIRDRPRHACGGKKRPTNRRASRCVKTNH